MTNPVKLIVQVVDARTNVPIPWTFVQVDGFSLSTGLDGTAVFELPTGWYTIRIRHAAYRPYTRKIHLEVEREYKIVVKLESAII